MRSLLPLCTVAALLSACGGGGAVDAPGAPLVLGKVTRNGESESGLSGVTVTCETTGEVDVTAADGSFRFEVPSGESITVRIEDGTLSVEGDGWDCDEGRDGTADGVDAGEDQVELPPLDEGEVVRLEIELERGGIVECWVGGDGERGAGECPLLPDPSLPAEARGELEVVRDGDCADVELEVSGLEGALDLDVVLLTPGGPHPLGTLSVGAEGTGHFEGRVCRTDLPEVPEIPINFGEPLPLPPGLPPEFEDLLDGLVPPTYPDVDPLACGLLALVDADGRVWFVGFLPGAGAEPGDGWSEPGGADGSLPDVGELPTLDELLDLVLLPPDLVSALEELLATYVPR